MEEGEGQGWVLAPVQITQDGLGQAEREAPTARMGLPGLLGPQRPACVIRAWPAGRRSSGPASSDVLLCVPANRCFHVSGFPSAACSQV